MTTAVLDAPAARTGHDTVPLTRLLAAELRWIFRRPQTLAVLGLLALIPIVIGIGLTLLGGPLMILCAVKFREFFSRKPEVAADGALDAVPEEVALHF